MRAFHNNKELFCRVSLALCLLLIYTTIPFARTFQTYVSTNMGRETFTWVALSFTLLLAIGGSWYLYASCLHRPWTAYLWLAIVALSYAYWAYSLKANPEVSLHLIEYGILTVLVFATLSFHVHDWSIYLITLLSVSLVATGDQIFKWFTPQRYFDYMDIRLNTGAAALMLLGIAKGFRPKNLSHALTASSARTATTVSTWLIFALALCLSNTPEVTARLTHLIPALSYLKVKDNLMCEYGYKYEDPEIGEFYSRFTLEKLQDLDTQRAVEAGNVIGNYKENNKYQAFLTRYSPLTDPFLHELRVHLFRRDQFIAQANQFNNIPAQFSSNATVAFRENQILEKYFSNTLKHSGSTLSQHQLLVLKRGLDPDVKYVSPVSSSLITTFDRKTMWIVALLSVLILNLIGRKYVSKSLSSCLL